MFSVLLSGVFAAGLAAVGAGDSTTETSAKRLDLLGLQVCMGDPRDGRPCHVKLYPVSEPQQEVPGHDAAGAPMPVEVALFGKRVCLGPVPNRGTCDVRLAPVDAPADPHAGA